MSGEYEVKIGDFGIGGLATEALIDHTRTMTTTGQVIPGGTLAYAAPEQWEQDRRPEPSDDVHAIGIMSLEMLTRKLRPFGNVAPAKLAYFDWKSLRADIKVVDSITCKPTLYCRAYSPISVGPKLLVNS